ncbi:tripartite tricarboxylate transporter substrate binding protein [Achromobacter insolitus]|uniref:tripartite tricarboxylate transporter substrate binding protein n=1 Tax=Achromobacter insolitus TaxID=217204 RepID=UPI0027E0C312|nr:tripartite tricarboxylate transporter substrate binding protein [Achromobacter insolitus]MDQ6212672.1 tripartite tricarboxylate transporter substrate binding protein [Achromobacter insolitus]
MYQSLSKTSVPARRRQLLAGMAMLALAAAPALAAAGDYPQHPIQLVVPYQAGGGADVMARAFSKAAAKVLPQGIVIVNKPGAAGVIGWQEVIRAKPDGYKVALTTVELTFLHHLGLAKFDQHALRPIAKLNADPAVIVVRSDSPYASIEDFLAQARKPDANIQIGNAGQGSMWHMASAALAEKGKATFNYIPYQGGAPALLGLLGGHIDAVIASAPEVIPYVNSGKLRALGVMSEKRIKGLDNTPTLRERNMDLVLGTWRGLAVPNDTPDAVVQVLREATEKSMRDPELREVMEKQFFTTDTYEDAPAFAASMDKEGADLKVIASGIALRP